MIVPRQGCIFVTFEVSSEGKAYPWRVPHLEHGRDDLVCLAIRRIQHRPVETLSTQWVEASAHNSRQSLAPGMRVTGCVNLWKYTNTAEARKGDYFLERNHRIWIHVCVRVSESRVKINFYVLALEDGRIQLEIYRFGCRTLLKNSWNIVVQLKCSRLHY